ncbi:MAG TPA: zinc metalloprotease HtpX [bacterium]
MKNTFKTTILLTILTVILIVFGNIVGGKNGMFFALMFAAIMNLGAYWFSDRLILAMYRAKEVSEADAPRLHRVVQNLALKAGIPKPKVYYMNSPSPNAFATGRNPAHAAVAVTEGIMNLLDEHELEGVLAHEIAHVKNRDTLISAVAATIAGAIVMIANMVKWAAIFGMGHRDNDRGSNPFALLALAVVAPLAATVVQLAISRTREFKADASGAQIAGSPMGLAGALRKLESASRLVPMGANPATAHLFIVNPLSGRSFLNLFSTHPPIKERIARLTEIRPE